MADGEYACPHCSSAFADLWELNVHIPKAHPGQSGIVGHPPTVSVRLWLPDAVVLYDWLTKVDLDTVPVQDRAEKQALTDLLNQLEQTLVEPTQEEIDIAREEVSD